MSDWPRLAVDVAIVLVLTFGLWLFGRRRSARAGNLLAALTLAAAVGVTLWRDPLLAVALVAAAFAAGGLIGWAIALRVDMIQIPAMVALQNGCGGLASCVVSYVELARGPQALPIIGLVAGLLGLLVGGATFSGSVVAAGKLAGRLRQTPRVLPHHNAWLGGLTLLALGAAAAVGPADGARLPALLLTAAFVSLAVGVVFSVRIGGADMPVLISFLNTLSGLAAALVGLVIGHRLLIACGTTVAASGTILTLVMCRAMNRPLLNVFTGFKAAPATPEAGGEQGTAPAAAPARLAPDDPYGYAADLMRQARSVVIIPGYGMALAHAQFEVVGLADRLARAGADVRFAVHPVAGRMPGHMHVLLAEADVDPDTLYEMDQVNDRFPETDLAVVVGACDVVNPAAVTRTGTPISGMPILLAHEAGRVLVFNLDDRPGYSGVENPLYDDPKTLLLLGDAKETVAEVRRRLG